MQHNIPYLKVIKYIGIHIIFKDFFESGSERMSDAEEEMEEVEEDEEEDEEGEEETEEGGSKKMLKRGISPIEWDVNSDELSEEEVEEEEEEESPQEEKSENGSEKSEEDESKRTYPDGKIIMISLDVCPSEVLCT